MWSIIKKVFYIFALLFVNDSFCDSFLEGKLKHFNEKKIAREELSSELFLKADSMLRFGNSAKALQYFKLALELTPEHFNTLDPKIKEASDIFIKSSLKISNKKCMLIKDRFEFTKINLPTRINELVEKFPNCLNHGLVEKKLLIKVKDKDKSLLLLEKDIKNKKLELKATQNSIVSTKIAQQKKLKELTAHDRGVLSLKKAIKNFVKIRNLKKIEKDVYNEFTKSLDYIQKMNSFFPKEIIDQFRLKSLDYLKLNIKKPTLKNVKKESSILNYRYSPKLININKKSVYTLNYKKYFDLFNYSHGDCKVQIGNGHLLVNSSICYYLGTYYSKNFRGRNGYGSTKQLRLFPHIIVLDMIIFLKNGKKINRNLIVNHEKFMQFDIEGGNYQDIAPKSTYGKYKRSQYFDLEFNNKLFKNIIDIKFTINKRITNEFNNLITEKRIGNEVYFIHNGYKKMGLYDKVTDKAYSFKQIIYFVDDGSIKKVPYNDSTIYE